MLPVSLVSSAGLRGGPGPGGGGTTDPKSQRVPGMSVGIGARRSTGSGQADDLDGRSPGIGGGLGGFGDLGLVGPYQQQRSGSGQQAQLGRFGHRYGHSVQGDAHGLSTA